MLATSVVAVISLPGVASAATKKVEAGPFGKSAREAFSAATADANAFFRRTTTVRKGDSVVWDINGFHTVTFVPRGSEAPGFVTADTETKVSGVNDAAGNPFWFNGQARLIVNLAAIMPAGSGTFDPDELNNSGLHLGEGAPPPYRLKFNRQGTFRYLCLVHPKMRGAVRVKSRRAKVPTAAQDRRHAQREQRILMRRAQRRTTGVGVPNTENLVQAGNDDRDGTAIFKFFPAKLNVKANTDVTLRMSPQTTEDHTFTFGPQAYLEQIAEQLIAPAPGGGAGPPTLVVNPLAAYPSDPPPAVPTITPTSHGNGFFNTGLLDRVADSPPPGEVRVRFGAAGTYQYICAIHPFMRGEVTVTG